MVHGLYSTRLQICLRSKGASSDYAARVDGRGLYFRPLARGRAVRGRLRRRRAEGGRHVAAQVAAALLGVLDGEHQDGVHDHLHAITRVASSTLE